MSEIYQHLVVQIEMTRIECPCPLFPEATFLTISVFPVHWLVVLYNLCHLIYISRYLHALSSALRAQDAALRWWLSFAVFLRVRTWREFSFDESGFHKWKPHATLLASD